MISGIHNFVANKNKQTRIEDKLEKFAVYYHNLFDFPLSFSELIKWTPAKLPKNHKADYEISCENGYCYPSGRRGLIYKRTLRKRFSEKKFLIAKKAARIMSFIPTIRMVAISGSLAMQNATEESDIDLFIITKKNKLWTTRAITYLVLKIFNFPIRKAGDSHQKNKLCLNMWFDEGSLIWESPQNIYTAHEIAQLVPLINKDKTYEKFIYKNKWIKEYWPNAVKIKNLKLNIQSFKHIYSITEKIAFWLQYRHMKSKITIETITQTRAIFHPQDLTGSILDRLGY